MGGGEAPGPGREPWALRDARDFARWAKHVSPPPDAAGRERRARARDACVWLPMLGGHAGCGPPAGDEVVQPVLRPAAGTECVPSLILSLGLAAWPSGTSFQLPADAKLCGQRPRLSRSPRIYTGNGARHVVAIDRAGECQAEAQRGCAAAWGHTPQDRSRVWVQAPAVPTEPGAPLRVSAPGPQPLSDRRGRPATRRPEAAPASLSLSALTVQSAVSPIKLTHPPNSGSSRGA